MQNYIRNAQVNTTPDADVAAIKRADKERLSLIADLPDPLTEAEQAELDAHWIELYPWMAKS